MKKPNITSGPWKTQDTHQGFLSDRFKGFPYSIQGADQFQTCLIFGDGEKNRGLAKANAQAIAALPDVLAALAEYHRLIVYLSSHGDMFGLEHNNAVDAEAAAKAALTKAGYTFS